MIQGKQTISLPKVASLYLMTVPVFELPSTTSNMYFVHLNSMNSVENTKIQKSIKTVSMYCKNSPELLYLLYLRLEISGHLNKTVKTPMPSYYIANKHVWVFLRTFVTIFFYFILCFIIKTAIESSI